MEHDAATSRHGPRRLLRIFWPDDVARRLGPGVALGWQNAPNDYLIVTIVFDLEPTAVQDALHRGILFENAPHPIERLLKLAGKTSLSVLGIVNGRKAAQIGSNPPLNFQLERHSPVPKLLPADVKDFDVQMILFQKPSPERMQYMSLKPISLALETAPVEVGAPLHADVTETGLKERLCRQSVTHHPVSQLEHDLPLVLNQINCAWEVSTLLTQNLSRIGKRQRRRLSVGERVVESAASAWALLVTRLWLFFMTYIVPCATALFKLGLLAHRSIAEALLNILTWRLRSDGAALKDVSATAQQVDIRLQQFCYWPIQYITLRHRRDDWASVTSSHLDYIRFYNSLWLVANDVIMGIALGSFIVDNADAVAAALETMLSDWALIGLRRMIEWLTDWPAGLKLNTELTVFLADLVLWVIEYWSYALNGLRPSLPGLVYFIGYSGFAGATLPIAIFSDLTSVLTLHIYAFYVASARIYNWQLTIIRSLFHLFRGRKHNVLRKRIDSSDYDLDQLLLGTILFTLLSFLLPTVLVFYLTFALSRMAIIVLKAVLDTSLACLNHFPLFALMLRTKDTWRLPGGIAFEILPTRPASASPENASDAQESCVVLKSIPLSMRAIFDQYFQLSANLRAHYLSSDVIFHLATGRFVPPIHRRNLYSLQYSMLPGRRISILELWKLLNKKRRPLVVGSFARHRSSDG